MNHCRCLLLAVCSLFAYGVADAQPAASANANYQQVNTYVNPVLPGDHPDPTLLKVGDDFYHCGSSFHFTPYLPIYHSKDLVHWKVISRVVPPSKAQSITDRPSAGIWQGAITYFYGSYWLYFSANGQWFCKAESPYGPWSDAQPLHTNAATGPLGYDNSIFVDDDGKPYMVIKNGQKVNRLQALGKDGQLADTVINLDWINAKLQYSWAEGPVMCKRNGYYYYFPAGDVSGGQYVLRTKKLSSDSTEWERLGEFFSPITDTATGFRRPNHIAAPVQLADGSWWTIGQSYERYSNDDWSGKGRQTALYPVRWEGDRPWGMAPTTAPIPLPALQNNGTHWRSVTADYFSADTLALCWHFLNRKDAAHYSLTARKGWVRLTPDSGCTSLLQKETNHYFTTSTRVDLDAADTSAKAGLYLTNGNQKTFVRLYTGFSNNRKEIVFSFDSAVRSIPNKFGQRVWLQLQRRQHQLSAFASADGKQWTPVGAPISAVNLDKTQPNYNSWVGTSMGLFAEGKPADFDFFICKDGAALLPAIGYSNYYGVEKFEKGPNPYVTNTTDLGGWLMISGVELSHLSKKGGKLAITAAAASSGSLEVWLDDLKNGRLIATVPIRPQGKGLQTSIYQQSLPVLNGQHDVFIKFPAGSHQQLKLEAIRFIASQ